MKNLYKSLSLLILLGFTACSDFIDLEPETSLSSAIAFDNIQGVEAGINGTYSTLHSDWVERQIIFAETLCSNVFEVNSLGNSNYQATLRHETWTDLNNVSNYLWRMGFQVIDIVNQIIVAMPEIAEPNQQIAAEKNRLLGEAYFLRGLNYFVLNRFYAQPKNGLSVPILTEPFKNGDTPFRGTIEDVRNQVIADLKEAETLMAGIESNNNRATIWAVKALLARVYFEFKDYQNAQTYANDVINNGSVEGRKLALINGGDFKSLYSSNLSSEHIYTFLGDPIDRANTRLFEIFSLESAAVELSMSKDFYRTISTEKKDLRIEQLTEDFRVAWACYKYDDREMNMPYIRLSEMYLIRAESKVNNGDLDGGLADLNSLRNRAGLDETTYTDSADLLEQLYRERTLELAMEGDNFHNLKRLEREIGGLPWAEASFKLVFFIPEKEVQLNPNLVQNEIW